MLHTCQELSNIETAQVLGIGVEAPESLLSRARLETAAVAFAANLPATKRALLAQGLERGGPLRHPPPSGGAAGQVP